MTLESRIFDRNYVGQTLLQDLSDLRIHDDEAARSMEDLAEMIAAERRIQEAQES